MSKTPFDGNLIWEKLYSINPYHRNLTKSPCKETPSDRNIWEKHYETNPYDKTLIRSPCKETPSNENLKQQNTMQQSPITET